MELINYRFLNYEKYSNFVEDLSEGKILDDSIVFVKDKRCIWARGKEYYGNTRTEISEQDGLTTLIVYAQNEEGVEESIATISQEDIKRIAQYLSNRIAEEANTAASNLSEAKNELNSTISSTKTELNQNIQNAESTLNTRIDNALAALNTRIGNEEQRAQNAEIRISTELHNSVRDINSAITNEKSDRESADNTLSDRISSLEGLIGVDIDGEINKFDEIIAFLQHISDDSDTSTLEKIIDAINTSIDSERTDREAADNDLDTKINGKLKTLQEYLGRLYVLKQDVYRPEDDNWSESPVYSFGELPVASVNEQLSRNDMAVVDSNEYELLKSEGNLRNDVCYLIYK